MIKLKINDDKTIEYENDDNMQSIYPCHFVSECPGIDCIDCPFGRKNLKISTEMTIMEAKELINNWNKERLNNDE